MSTLREAINEGVREAWFAGYLAGYEAAREQAALMADGFQVGEWDGGDVIATPADAARLICRAIRAMQPEPQP